MNIKRSYFRVLLASVSVGLLLTNCTVKSSDDDGCKKGSKHNGCDCPSGVVGYQVCGSDGTYGECVCGMGVGDDTCTEGDKASGCSCAGNLVGYQVCDTEGVYGACVCPDDSGGGDGGTTSGTGGSSGSGTTGGSDATSGGSGLGLVSEGGGGGGGGGGGADLSDIDPTNCDACLQQLCSTELSACLNDDQCVSTNVDGSGQYERISACIEGARFDGLVTREAVRGCGVTTGLSTDADLGIEWAPEGMAASTTNLLNCLATSSDVAPNADWANDPDLYPVVDEMVVPAPWPAKSCAKLACTSKLMP